MGDPEWVSYPIGGGAVLIDVADIPLVGDGALWRARTWKGRTYAILAETPGGMNKIMHRVIMGEPKGLQVDHRNHDALDNRRSNLRICTHGQNVQNQRPRANLKSGFKGVQKRVGATKTGWTAMVYKDGARYYLGTFSTGEDAARAYDAKAIELFGEFACPNFPILEEAAR